MIIKEELKKKKREKEGSYADLKMRGFTQFCKKNCFFHVK